MKTSMNQVLLMVIMLKHTLVNRNIGSVKLASVSVVELFSSNNGLSWMMPRLNMRVGEPIDHKHGWSFDSKTKLHQVWNHLEKLGS